MKNSHLLVGLVIGGGMWCASYPSNILKIIGGLCIISGLGLGVMWDVDKEKMEGERYNNILNCIRVI